MRLPYVPSFLGVPPEIEIEIAVTFTFSGFRNQRVIHPFIYKARDNIYSEIL